ncbi:MAG TPA: type II secretion protein, partial [Nitrospiraceae bacterium]|nr:type II secretion protein [Nitrospiraceae bacterium]
MMKSDAEKAAAKISPEARTWGAQAERLLLLLDQGVLTAEELHEAEDAAVARGIGLERILITEYHLSRSVLLEALSAYYHCPSVLYDERMPIPPGLLSGLDSDRLFMSQWFPMIRDGDMVIIAANNPQDPEMRHEVAGFIKAEKYEFWVALEEDVQWFIQDFLHAQPGYLIGTERTGLAFWRNTMAQWRTRLACYRNDLAKGRTGLAFLRWGLGMIAIADTLMLTKRLPQRSSLPWLLIAVGLSIAVYGLSAYWKVRQSRMKPPRHQTLVEVTAATLQFLENYHFIEGAALPSVGQKTMLGRLGDFLADHSTILFPSPASRERTHLARERNVLAAQRTVAACYRTIYARARTGLAFIRSGVSFSSLGLALMHYFGLSV